MVRVTALFNRLERAWRRATGGVGPRGEATGVENIIWIFGTIRTGSTWLGSMMGDLENHDLWNEPRVGELFGHFFYERSAHRRENNNFILGLNHKRVWLDSIRTFVLDSVRERYPGITKGEYLVIKEPSGSIGAPLLMEALPESRMILLVRDPRDVVASSLDAARKGSWTSELRGSRKRRQMMDPEQREAVTTRADRQPNKHVGRQANVYLQAMGNSRQAYEVHAGPKAVVRYEDLRADTLGTMRRMYSALDIDVPEKRLAGVVEKHAWENVPEEEKGPGKFKRKATPGGWREDLTPEQVEIVERVTAPLLREFYPE